MEKGSALIDRSDPIKDLGRNGNRAGSRVLGAIDENGRQGKAAFLDVVMIASTAFYNIFQSFVLVLPCPA